MKKLSLYYYISNSKLVKIFKNLRYIIVKFRIKLRTGLGDFSLGNIPSPITGYAIIIIY